MLSDINCCCFCGNATRDAKYGVSPSGTTYLSFSLAVHSATYSSAEGKYVETVAFIDCVAFGDLAESNAGKIKRGNKISIQAQLRQGSFTDGGKVRKKDSFICSEIECCDVQPKKEKKWISPLWKR